MKRGIGAVVVGAGTALASAGRSLLLALHAREHVERPRPLVVDGRTFDVVADLSEYTGLSPVEVDALLRRRIDSFRVEWHTMRPRSETWFYLSSRGYLFANAPHFHGTAELALLREAIPAHGRVLDFGGGTGNLTLALAAGGFQVDYLELSALQKDFTRFRVAKHDLGKSVRILDGWEPLPNAAYDLICAFDVLEHLEDLPEQLVRLLAALAPNGVVAESSLFIRNVSNPMHHEDVHELDSLLERSALELIATRPELRFWRRRANNSGGANAT